MPNILYYTTLSYDYKKPREADFRLVSKVGLSVPLALEDDFVS